MARFGDYLRDYGAKMEVEGDAKDVNIKKVREKRTG